MDDLIGRCTPYLGHYVDDLLALARGPKHFIDATDLEDDLSRNRALRFLAFSVILVVLIVAGVAEHFWKVSIAAGATMFVFVVAISMIASKLWRAFGGNVTDVRYLTFYAYSTGFGIIVMMFIIFVTIGTFSSILFVKQDVYQRVWAAYLERGPAPNSTDITIASTPLLICLSGMVWLWLYNSRWWAAFRRMNGLSRWRSFFVSSLFSIALLPVATLCFVFYVGLSVFSVWLGTLT